MQLHHKVLGEGEPLLVLHGLFGTLDNWQTLAKTWSEQWQVYLIDQRNHGRSPQVHSISYPEMAQDLAEFMDQNRILKAHVLGHSMGGKVAMEFALNYPDLVDKLIVVDIAPKPYPPGHDDIFRALFAIDMATLQNRQEAETILGQHIDDWGTRQFLLKNLSRLPEGGFEWKMNLPVIHRDYANILANLRFTYPFEGPCLFIRGAQSRYVLDEDFLTIQAHFPHAILQTVANAGHWVHADQPAALSTLVIDFLTKNE
jgi:esterase